MTSDIKIPRCMSTQHPDNAVMPPFVSESLIGGEDEVKEAHYAFSQLGCDEQMWDHEGKEVDEFVVSKLFTEYESFFKRKKLGEDVFLTLRVPNPAHQKADGKVLLEVLESIPRFFDVARHFYQHDKPPIFEVILPMTTNALELDRIWHYYQRFVSGKSDTCIFPKDIQVKKWVGEFKPEIINVIPLIEEKHAMLRADEILRNFLKGKDLPYQRIFLARSDPAESYGSLSAVLLLKIALNKISRLEKNLGIPLYPIVGVGSVPFRGNFKPTNVENCLRGYPSVQTFTLQSAFKFDYPESVVQAAVRKIKAAPRKKPIPLENEKQAVHLIDKVHAAYAVQVEALAPLINTVAKFVPARRKRKLHIGLFGYARSIGSHHLPRAITFCSALYSLGLPPELLGLDALTKEDLVFVNRIYPDFKEDLRDALQYFDEDVLSILPYKVQDAVKHILELLDHSPTKDVNQEHRKITRFIRFCVNENETDILPELITRAAKIRKFLG